MFHKLGGCEMCTYSSLELIDSLQVIPLTVSCIQQPAAEHHVTTYQSYTRRSHSAVLACTAGLVTLFQLLASRL